MMRSALYTGTVVHARRDNHARRTFRYPLYMASLDLDELPTLDRELRLFSHRRRNVFAFDERDYEGGSLALADLRAANGLPVPATTRFVTNLRVFGYVFNPVSFFLDYDATGALVSVIAEINNTYGGRRRYVMGPAQRIASTPPVIDTTTTRNNRGDAISGRAPLNRRVGFRHVRELFVSPFLHGDASYEFWFDAPLDGDELAITMHVDMHDAGLTRSAGDTRSASSDTAPARSRSDARDAGFGANDAGAARSDARDAGFGANDAGAARSDARDAGFSAHARAAGIAVVRNGGSAEPDGANRDRVFVARFAGERRPMRDRTLAALAVRYPLMTLQVIGLIHLEALKLRWMGLPYRRPGSDHRPIASPTSIVSKGHRSTSIE